jgi:hypothetical protein
MEDQKQKEIFEQTFLFLQGKFKERKDEKDVFSEKGLESFAEFAWETGKALIKMRRSIGWESSHIKEMAELLQKTLKGKMALYPADLFHLCDYYSGCEKLSKLLWKPIQSPIS